MYSNFYIEQHCSEVSKTICSLRSQIFSWPDHLKCFRRPCNTLTQTTNGSKCTHTNIHTQVHVHVYVCTHAHCSQCKQHTLHTKRLLQTLHMFLRNLCKRHSLKKDLLGGRLAALPTAPSGETRLYCPLLIQGMATETGIYCLCEKPHPLKDCPPLCCSFSVHILSEEFEVIWTVCREGTALHSTFLYK